MHLKASAESRAGPMLPQQAAGGDAGVDAGDAKGPAAKRVVEPPPPAPPSSPQPNEFVALLPPPPSRPQQLQSGPPPDNIGPSSQQAAGGDGIGRMGQLTRILDPSRPPDRTVHRLGRGVGAKLWICGATNVSNPCLASYRKRVDSHAKPYPTTGPRRAGWNILKGQLEA